MRGRGQVGGRNAHMYGKSPKDVNEGATWRREIMAVRRWWVVQGISWHAVTVLD